MANFLILNTQIPYEAKPTVSLGVACRIMPTAGPKLSFSSICNSLQNCLSLLRYGVL